MVAATIGSGGDGFGTGGSGKGTPLMVQVRAPRPGLAVPWRGSGLAAAAVGQSSFAQRNLLHFILGIGNVDFWFRYVRDLRTGSRLIFRREVSSVVRVNTVVPAWITEAVECSIGSVGKTARKDHKYRHWNITHFRHLGFSKADQGSEMGWQFGATI
jgi:hypothetical protein